MSLSTILSCLYLFVFITVVGAAEAGVQEITPREKEMMAVIESLQERVSALEAAMAESQTAPAPAADQTDLEGRVEALETTAVSNAPEPGDFRVHWDEGLRLDTADGQARLKMGGRIHNDWFWYDQDDALQRGLDLEDGAEFRRARLYLSGVLYENLLFEAEYDFAGGVSSFKDVYLELTGIPVVQNLRVGHFKEPFSLDELTSSNDITFMERALPNVFAPGRNTGAMVHGAYLGDPGAERVSTALGIFRTADDFGNDADDGGYSGTIRVTGLPWYGADGRNFFHLGAAYTHRNPDDTIRLRQRPESGNAAHFLDTGDFEAEDIDSFALEAALAYGPFSLQGEYMTSDVETRLLGSRDFDGFYVQGSYLITGERRPYDHGDGTFGRPDPARNFAFHDGARGWGAWEVALRYSSLDLDGGGRLLAQAFGGGRPIRGGSGENITVGLNWYLNPNARVMLNYVIADIDSRMYDGDLNILQTRFQLAF